MIHLYFKPHELTPKNPTKNSSWPRLAIQLSKERLSPSRMLPIPERSGLFATSKAANKKTSRQNCRDANLYNSALIVDAD
jgi:hypothetical protein